MRGTAPPGVTDTATTHGRDIEERSGAHRFRACDAALHTTRTHDTLSRTTDVATIKQTLDELLTADGALCAAIVDSNSGMMLGSAGSGVDLEVAAAGNTEVMRAKMKVMRALGLNDVIEDMLITLGKQYHIIRPSSRKEGVFIYYVLDKARSNLAMARRKAQDVDKDLSF